MSQSTILVIADDLTGAADTGVAFAAAGYSTAIPLSGHTLPAADVLALTTESRDLLPEQAFATVTSAVARSWRDDTGYGETLIYKKIDSALRGHPGPELAAVMEVTGLRRAIVAPAFPGEGRTTIGGIQHLHGQPIAHGPMGVTSSDVRAVIGIGHDIPVRSVGLDVVRGNRAILAAALAGEDEIVQIDAETDDDLARIARAAVQVSPAILSGAAGFARALATILPMHPAIPDPVTLDKRDRPVLVVAGSQHAATARQVETLRGEGAAVVQLSQEIVDADDAEARSEMDFFSGALALALTSGNLTVVTTAGLAPARSGGRSIAERLAAIVTAPEVVDAVGGLSLTGGDVAMAACHALGAEAIWLRGEIAAGQPWGVLAGGMRPGLPVATKAGSFGGPRALCDAATFLTAVQRGD